MAGSKAATSGSPPNPTSMSRSKHRFSQNSNPPLPLITLWWLKKPKQTQAVFWRVPGVNLTPGSWFSPQMACINPLQSRVKWHTPQENFTFFWQLSTRPIGKGKTVHWCWKKKVFMSSARDTKSSHSNLYHNRLDGSLYVHFSDHYYT